MDKKQLGIYIHIPFCAQKCIYCDFLSVSSNNQMMEKYTDALIMQLQNEKEYVKKYNIKTVFLGGGTPSFLPVQYMEKILDVFNREYDLSDVSEFTMECNPGTLNKEKVSLYKKYGVNRISLGLQSANNSELKMLSRIHTYEQFLESYKIVRDAGFENVNVDLMSALPYQTRESYCDTLNKVISLEPEHISAYSLIVEDGTEMKKMVENAKNSILPDEDTERWMYYDTKRILHEHGYERYEISNYSKPGYECRHNLSYWERIPYLGLGLGASSYLDGKRLVNTDDFEIYFKSQGKRENIICETEELTKEDMMAEYMFLGLRKTKGISISGFEAEFGVSIYSIYEDVLKKHEEENLIVTKGDFISFTEKGLDVSNYVLSDYLL